MFRLFNNTWGKKGIFKTILHACLLKTYTYANTLGSKRGPWHRADGIHALTVCPPTLTYQDTSMIMMDGVWVHVFVPQHSGNAHFLLYQPLFNERMGKRINWEPGKGWYYKQQKRCQDVTAGNQKLASAKSTAFDALVKLLQGTPLVRFLFS